VAVTRKDNKRFQSWEKRASTGKCLPSPEWTPEQYRGTEVRGKMQKLRSMLMEELPGETPNSMSENAFVHGVWKLFCNTQGRRHIQHLFALNEGFEAVGMALDYEPRDCRQWLGAVFEQLTAVDYTTYGRSQFLGSFRLCEEWQMGNAAHQVASWVDCMHTGSMKRTWEEARTEVCALLDATTFRAVLEKKQVMDKLRLLYNECRTDATRYWEQVQALLVQQLEGDNGVREWWLQWERSEAGTYRGPYEEEFQAIKPKAIPPHHQPMGTGHRVSKGRVNQVQEESLAVTQMGHLAPEQHRVMAMAQKGSSPLPEVEYATEEVAQRRAWEPCGWHIQKAREAKENSLRDDELVARMHPNCACLNVRNPMLRCTLLDGGIEAIFKRQRMPRGPERESLWKAQRDEVDSKRQNRQPSYVNEIKAREINEEGDGVLRYTGENGLGQVLLIAGPPSL
jgi:hypothetical protein